MDFGAAFSGSGGYDFGGSSSATGGTNTVNYRNNSSGGLSPMLLLGAIGIAALVLLKR